MQIDWKPLFDSLRIQWRDRGSNTSSGNTNICCPFCRDDQGFHLALSDEKPAYYCYRNPRQHSGSNFVKVFIALRIERPEALRIMNSFRSNKAPSVGPEIPIKTKDANVAWQRMQGLQDAGLAYLQSRGFENAREIAEQYDLRSSSVGEWAQRVLFPITDCGQVKSWHGRAIRANHIPKYLAFQTNAAQPGLLYVPDEQIFQRHGITAIIVEGQIDALKINAAMKTCGAIALAGKSFGPAKLIQLARLLRKCKQIFVTMDGDAPLSDAINIINEIRTLNFVAPIRRLSLPPPYKDAGEMSYQAIREWLGDKQ